VGLSVALGFCAAAALYASVARLTVSQAFLAAPDAGGALMGMIRDDLAAANRFRWIGTSLALLPAVVLAARGPARWRAMAVAGAALAVLLAGVFVLDARVASVRTPMGALEDVLASYGAELEEGASPVLEKTTDGPSGKSPVELEEPTAIPEMPVEGALEGVEGGVVGGVPSGVGGGITKGVVGGVAPDGELVPAQALYRPTPSLPPGALAAGERRTVIVRVGIDAGGAVTDATVLRSASGPLDSAALEAARRSRFRPAMQGGTPVPSTQVLTYQFVAD
jgi:TonB family protein